MANVGGANGSLVHCSVRVEAELERSIRCTAADILLTRA